MEQVTADDGQVTDAACIWTLLLDDALRIQRAHFIRNTTLANGLVNALCYELTKTEQSLKKNLKFNTILVQINFDAIKRGWLTVTACPRAIFANRRQTTLAYHHVALFELISATTDNFLQFYTVLKKIPTSWCLTFFNGAHNPHVIGQFDLTRSS